MKNREIEKDREGEREIKEERSERRVVQFSIDANAPFRLEILEAALAKLNESSLFLKTS